MLAWPMWCSNLKAMFSTQLVVTRFYTLYTPLDCCSMDGPNSLIYDRRFSFFFYPRRTGSISMAIISNHEMEPGIQICKRICSTPATTIRCWKLISVNPHIYRCTEYNKAFR